ncbi:MAG: hypothetical protein OXF67_08955 [Cyanobacteria bacterium MAG CAR4_bin_6]|nr:hypothetical protein [Cyanobacteria bacterium MAG CAR4_bin_6]
MPKLNGSQPFTKVFTNQMSILSKHTSDMIKNAMGKLSDLPTPVGDWIIETGIDSTDEEAVWVWAMLKEDEDKIEFNKIEELESIITKQVKQIAGSDTTAYVRFRGVSEEV